MNMFAKLGMIVFILIGLSVVGYLAHGQMSLSDKLDIVTNNQVRVMTTLDNVNKAIEVLFKKADEQYKQWPNQGGKK